MREPQLLPRRRRRPRMQFRFAQPLTPALSHGERETYGDVLQSRFAQTLIPAFSQWEKGEEREAIRRLNPAIPEEVVSACAGIRSEA